MTEPTARLCPDCRAPLVIRENPATGQEFLSCLRFPVCRHSEPLTAYHEQRRRGAPMLPGLEETR